MNSKSEFLGALRQQLNNMNVSNVDSIIRDYDEHFSHATGAGKSEAEVIAKLGPVEQIAKAFETENFAKQVKEAPRSTDLFSVLGRALLLTPLNFFILIGPAIAIISVLISGWCVSGVLTLLSVIGILGGFALAPLAGIGGFGVLGVFFGAVGLLSFSLIGIMAMTLITQAIVKLFASYLRWNVQFLLNK